MTAEPIAPTRADQLEARCRKAMAVLPKARGWDSRRVREDELAVIDVLLDEWNVEMRAGLVHMSARG